jgi:hypothetical protein
VVVQQPLWYRCIAFVSATIWVNVLWLVACVPIVSAPAATAALLSETRLLLDGDGVRWRRFFETLRVVFRTSLLTGAILVPLWIIGAFAVVLGGAGNSPVLLGVGTVAVGAIAVVSTVTTVAASTGPARVATIFRRVGIAVLIRPGTCILMTMPAFAMGLTVLFAPHWVLGFVVFGIGPLVAECTLVIAHMPTRDDHSRAGRLKRMVLDAGCTSDDVLEFADARR